MRWTQRVQRTNSYFYGIIQDESCGKKKHYFVHILPEREAEFLKAMNENQPFSLNHYGKVVYASYKKPSPRKVIELERQPA